MRLYYKDADGSEITKVNFDTVRKVMTSGGQLQCTIRDLEFANVNTNLQKLSERVEVRKNDGSTVIWEGIITKANQTDRQAILKGMSILSYLNKINANYRGLFASGVVTTCAGAVVTDANNTFPATVNGAFTMFSNKTDVSTEIIYPNVNSDWYNNVGAGADDPAETETKTPTGDETDLGAGGQSYWEIWDSSARGDNWYGIEPHFTVTNEDTSTHIRIELTCGFDLRDSHTVTAPEIQIYDFTAAGWQANDAQNAGNITGLGDITYTDQLYNSKGSHYFTVIEITANMGRYFDGAHEAKVRVLCGQAAAGGQEKVRLYRARVINTYSARFDTALGTAYEVDAYTSTTLTFTGQTPCADGVTVGDLYKVGDKLSNHISNIWRDADIIFADLDFDATTLVEAVNYKNMYVGNILRNYALRLNREVWQQIGWTIQCKSSYTASTKPATLTEADFLPGTIDYGANIEDLIIRATGAAAGKTLADVSDKLRTATGDYFGNATYMQSDWNIGSLAELSQGLANILTKYQSQRIFLTGMIDLDNGTDYSELDIGMSVDVDLFSSAKTMTAAKIRRLSYTQNKGEHLLCSILIEG